MRTMEFDMRIIEELEDKIVGIQEVMETKLDKTAVDSMLEDKVGKNELIELLPDQDALDKKFVHLCEE